MPNNYSVRVYNHSDKSADFIIFQTDDDLGVPNAYPLAWLCKRIEPNTYAVFEWTTDYQFVWSDKGIPAPGAIFQADESVNADLTINNSIGFTCSSHCHFSNIGVGPAGRLTIRKEDTIPADKVTVGIGMSGNPVFVVKAIPDKSIAFTPHPRYWIAFGNYVPGQVLDRDAFVDSFEIVFRPGTDQAEVRLNRDDTWTVS